MGSLRVCTFLFVLPCLFFNSTFASEFEVRQSLMEYESPIDLKSGFGRDHAALEEVQNNSTESFKKDSFFDENGFLSSNKIGEFIERLRLERVRLHSDLKESHIIERLELDVKLPDKAIKEDSNAAAKIVKVYDDYLIPTLLKLKTLVDERKQLEEWGGLLDDFVRAYHIFYYPNAKMTMFSRNKDVFKTIKRLFFPYHFKKTNPNQDEAINLMVEPHNLEEIEKCLGKAVTPYHYLTRTEVSELKNKCKFDISRVNPGVSALWEDRTSREIEIYKNGRDEIFPTENTKLLFKEVMLTGAGSPKVEVSAMLSGKERRFKVKWGREVHADLVTSKIAYFLGFNQDTMKYFEKVKVHLGKYTVSQFESLLNAKNGQSTVLNSVLQKGGKPGDEWVVIRDVLLEARPEEEIRILPFDPVAMDFNERREFNARLLLNSFLGIMDLKVANYKFLLAKSNRSGPSAIEGDERPRVFLRLQDMGYSLGPTINVWKLKQVPYFAGSKYLPNEFEASGIVVADKKKENIKIRWNDFNYQEGLFDHATYWDLKWIARKIASLKADDLEWCFKTSGMPREVAELYLLKLISRQSEIRSAFELEDETPAPPGDPAKDWKSLTTIPEDPKDLPAVVKGEVVKTHFRNRKIFLLNQNTWGYLLLQQLNSAITTGPDQAGLADFGKRPITSDLNARFAGKGVSGLYSDLGLAKQQDDRILGTPVQIPLGVGISATLSRQVLIDSVGLHSEDDQKARPYLVRDRITFRVGIGSGLLGTILSYLPVSIQGSIQFYEYTIEADHYAEGLIQGYRKVPTALWNAIRRPIFAAAKDLGRMEVIRKSSNIGLNASVNLSIFKLENVIDNQISSLGGLLKLSEISYYRDPLGVLHVMTQDTNENFRGIDILLGHLPNPVVSRFALMGYKNAKMNFHTVLGDIVAGQKDQDRSHDSPIYDNDGRYLESLKKIKNGIEERDLPTDMKYRFRIDAKGSIESKSKSIFYLINKNKMKSTSKAKLDFEDGHQKVLSRHMTAREKYTGLPISNVYLLAQKDLAVKWAQRTLINSELDEYRPDGFTIWIRIIDFLRSANHDGLEALITSLNNRYSQDDKTPFYRDYSLPSKEEVNDYRRLYSMTRVFISGKDLLDRIELISEDDFKKLMDMHFVQGKERYTGKSETGLNPMHWLVRKIANARLEKHLLHYFRKLQEIAKAPKRDYAIAFKYIDKFLYHQKLHKYGLGLTKSLVGEDSLLVVGEISGVFPSFSTSNDLQERQRRRFAAKHWGTLSLLPPIQYQNKYDFPILQTIVSPQIPFETIFGGIPNGYPGELRQEW